MATGVSSRCKRGPGDWGLCGVGGLEPGVTASVAETSKVRKFAAPEHRFDNCGLQPVETQNDDLPIHRLSQLSILAIIDAKSPLRKPVHRQASVHSLGPRFATLLRR